MSKSNATFRIVILGLAGLAIAMGIGRFAFTPLLPLMQNDGLLSVGDGGMLASVHFLGYLLGAIFSAKIPLAPKPTLKIALICIALSTLAMGLTDNFAIWLALRWMAGVCSALTLVLISNYYVRYLGQIGTSDKQGWIFAGVGAGIAIAGLGTLIIMANQIGSALSWQAFGILSLLAVFAICAKMGPEIPAVRQQTADLQPVSTPLQWRLVIAYGTAGMGYILPATYLPIMAREIVPDPLLFGWSWPVFGFAAFVSTLLAAPLQRYFSNQQVWAVSQLVMAFGLLLPLLFSGLTAIILAGFCVRGTFMIITMIGMKETHRIAALGDVARHIAVMTAAFAGGQMIGPIFAGRIYQFTQSFAAALALAAFALIVTAAPLLINSAKPAPGAG